MKRFCSVFHLRSDPLCPFCGEPLHGDALEFYHSIACCKPCVEVADYFGFETFVGPLRALPPGSYWSTARGISFFTPSNLDLVRLTPALAAFWQTIPLPEEKLPLVVVDPGIRLRKE